MEAIQYLKGTYRKAGGGGGGGGLSRRAGSDRTRENSFKLQEGGFGLDIREKYFTGCETLEKVVQ